MNKRIFKAISCFIMSASILGGSQLFTMSANAVPLKGYYQYGNYGYTDTHVSNSHDLIAAVSAAKDGDVVALDNDIILDKTLEIKASIVLDLRGHNITMNRNTGIKIGNKVFNHTEYYTVNHPGYYTKEKVVTYVKNPDVPVYDDFGNFMHNKKVPDTEVVTYQDVWHPGWAETKSVDIYDYLDNIDVVIENGSIKGASGLKGVDGTADTFFDCDGGNGTKGATAITVISGTLRANNATILGGNGGSGGDGRYQAILHIPFFTGNGGNGGNGGDAGHAIALERSECNVIEEGNTRIECGVPGQGGIGGEPNAHHWIGTGSAGDDGQSGSVVSAILKK